MFDEFQVLHGDRLFDEDAAIVGAVARLGEILVMVVGHSAATPRARWSSATSACRIPRATARAPAMRHAAKFGMPIVTPDTPGAHPGLGGEERGQSIAIAQSTARCRACPS